MRLKALIFAIIIVLGVAVAFASAPALVGTWLGKTDVPDQGRDDLVLVFTKTEAGLGGTVTDTLGIVAQETKLSEIKVDGDSVTFQFPLADGTLVACLLNVGKDKMTGTWTHSEGDTGKLEFARKI